MTLLSKTAILAAQDLQTEDVEVPEWGGAVRVRSFTGRERDAFQASMVRGDGRDRKVDRTNMRARLVGLTVIDETGQRLFTDEEVDLLEAKSGAALDRVFAVAQKLNGLSGCPYGAGLLGCRSTRPVESRDHPRQEATRDAGCAEYVYF